MKKLYLSIDTTGVEHCDRIIRVNTMCEENGRSVRKVWMLNPGCHIGEKATLSHGIKNEDVQGCPSFEEKYGEIYEYLKSAEVVCGWGVLTFDIPFLQKEFERMGRIFNIKNIIDTKKVFMETQHPFDSRDAYNRLFGKSIDNEIDADRQLVAFFEDKYTKETIDEICGNGKRVDMKGFFVRENGTIVIGIGKHKGVAYDKVPMSYYEWVVNESDMPLEVKVYAKRVLEKLNN